MITESVCVVIVHKTLRKFNGKKDLGSNHQYLLGGNSDDVGDMKV